MSCYLERLVSDSIAYIVKQYIAQVTVRVDNQLTFILANLANNQLAQYLRVILPVVKVTHLFIYVGFALFNTASTLAFQPKWAK